MFVQPTTRRLPAGDSGDIVLGWLTKLTLILAVIGVVLFDAISVGVAHVSGTDDADSAAVAASDAWHASHEQIQAAYDAAEQWATAHKEDVSTKNFTVDPDGTVHLMLSREATTLVLYRIKPLRRYATVTVSGTGQSLGS